MLQKNEDYKLLWNGFFIYGTGTTFFLQKLELGKSQSYVIFLDADGPLHDAERGKK